MLGVSLLALGYLADQVPADAPWQTQILSRFALFDQRPVLLVFRPGPSD